MRAGHTDGVLATACRVTSVVSAAGIVALLLFYAVELRSTGGEVFGPLSDVLAVPWNVLLVVLVVGFRPALGTGPGSGVLVGGTIALSAAGAAASALLVVEVLPFAVSTTVSVLDILVQSLWLHELNRHLRGSGWSRRTVGLGVWAPRGQALGAVLVGASLLLPWGSTGQVAVMVAGLVPGLASWLAWPVWFALAARQLERVGLPRLVSPIDREPSRS